MFAEAAKPLGVRVTTEEELGSAFADAAQAQRDGRCALIEVILNPAPSVPVLALRGVITLRVAGRLHHIGVGRTYTGTRVLVLIQDLRIRIIHAATGELLRELTLNPSKDYQPTGAPKGPQRKKFRT